MTTRRMILTAGAASLVVVGAGLGAARLLRSDISDARAPWAAAGAGGGDPRLDALSYAILAPSPHNRQPWLARLDGEDVVMLYCDPSRLLPETDPPNRQIVIGLGAFLEILRQAASAQGYAADIEPFPDGASDT
ncbi:MAG: twin-arginine translocation pathway signal protein, partial [Pseudomonadota bacterium]